MDAIETIHEMKNILFLLGVLAHVSWISTQTFFHMANLRKQFGIQTRKSELEYLRTWLQNFLQRWKAAVPHSQKKVTLALQMLKDYTSEGIRMASTVCQPFIFKTPMASIVCLKSPQLLFLSDQYQFGIETIKFLNLNLSFEKFDFSNRLGCKGSFMKTFFLTSDHVFCGKRHPWIMLCPSYFMLVEVKQGKGHFRMFYQVMSSSIVKKFQMLQYLLNPKGFIEDSGEAMLLISSRLHFNNKVNFFFINIKTPKFMTLVVTLKTETLGLITIFDGPSADANTLSPKDGQSSMRCSGFFAILVAKNYSAASIWYNGVILNHKPKLVSHFLTHNHLNMSFSADSSLGPFYSQVLWFKVSVKRNIAVRIKDFSSTGPQEMVERDKYCGIAVYFKNKENKTEQILTVNHNVKYVYGRFFDAIGKVDTESVAIVFYSYTLYCSLISTKITLTSENIVAYYFKIHPAAYYICLNMFLSNFSKTLADNENCNELDGLAFARLPEGTAVWQIRNLLFLEKVKHFAVFLVDKVHFQYIVSVFMYSLAQSSHQEKTSLKQQGDNSLMVYLNYNYDADSQGVSIYSYHFPLYSARVRGKVVLKDVHDEKIFSDIGDRKFILDSVSSLKNT